jgi:hypothetical protein
MVPLGALEAQGIDAMVQMQTPNSYESLFSRLKKKLNSILEAIRTISREQACPRDYAVGTYVAWLGCLLENLKYFRYWSSHSD